MANTFERVHFEGEERVVPKLYRHEYSTATGKQRIRFYGVFTDWLGIRRRFPLGEEREAGDQGNRKARQEERGRS